MDGEGQLDGDGDLTAMDSMAVDGVPATGEKKWMD